MNIIPLPTLLWPCLAELMESQIGSPSCLEAPEVPGLKMEVSGLVLEVLGLEDVEISSPVTSIQVWPLPFQVPALPEPRKRRTEGESDSPPYLAWRLQMCLDLKWKCQDLFWKRWDWKACKF